MEIKALAICGSLRKDSYNRKLLALAKKIVADMDMECAELDLKKLDIPMYDGDIQEKGLPKSVLAAKKEIENCDLLLIASPEYNNSVSGVLKNLIDWASRGNNSFDGKVAAIFGASMGQFGTVRGQLHLRQILAYLNVLIVAQPQVYVWSCDKAFNSDGTLIDAKTADLLKQLIAGSVALVKCKK
ncbi:MAG: NAD(P)H-dependent oxidoreductase [Patescibacteria group bacterium]|nr:NAD(P)H-dependent oxidoreductase [Patescibacteria group bacterium]